MSDLRGQLPDEYLYLAGLAYGHIKHMLEDNSFLLLFSLSQLVAPQFSWLPTEARNRGAGMVHTWVSFTTTSPLFPCQTSHQAQHSLLPNLDININF